MLYIPTSVRWKKWDAFNILLNNHSKYALCLSRTRSYYLTIKYLEALAERCCTDQKKKKKKKKSAILKCWICQYVAGCAVTYWHIKYKTTNIKPRYQSIVSLLSLYWFFLKLFSSNLLCWWQVITNSDFLLSKLGSFNDFI